MAMLKRCVKCPAQEEQHQGEIAALCTQHSLALDTAAAKSVQEAEEHGTVLEQQHQQLVAELHEAASPAVTL